MKTGISVFDKALPKGLSKVKITILGTKCAMGKTMLSGMIANTVYKEGKNVLFLTADEQLSFLRKKILNSFFGHDKYTKEMVEEAVKGLGTLAFKKIPTIATDPETLANEIRSYDINFDLIVLDGVHFIDGFNGLKLFNERVNPKLLFTNQIYNNPLGNDLKYLGMKINENLNAFILDVKHDEIGNKVGSVSLNGEYIGNISYNIFGEVKNI